MTEDDIDAVIGQHLLMHRIRCECGEYLGSNPKSFSRHLARKIYEAMLNFAGH